MDVGKFSRRRLYTGRRLDYRLRLWTPISVSRTVSTVAELLVTTVSSHWKYLWRITDYCTIPTCYSLLPLNTSLTSCVPP